MSLPCLCTPNYSPCGYCEAAIAVAEDARANPPSDYRDDYLDNRFERAMYPKQWEAS